MVTRKPLFCTVVFIIDLFFCSLRVLQIPLSFYGWHTLTETDPENPMLATVPYEVLCGVLLVLFGITANSALLAGKRWGVPVMYATLLVTAGSVVLGFVQFHLMPRDYGSDAERIGAYVGVGFVVAFRVVLTALVIVALVMFQRWWHKRHVGLAEEFE